MNKYWNITVIKMSISLINTLHKLTSIPEKLIPMNEQQLLQHQALNVMEVIEDSVEMLCDEYLISGEKVWVMIQGLADLKVKEFPLYEEEN